MNLSMIFYENIKIFCDFFVFGGFSPFFRLINDRNLVNIVKKYLFCADEKVSINKIHLRNLPFQRYLVEGMIIQQL